MEDSSIIIGIDLAWGWQSRDGVCILRFPDGLEREASPFETQLVFGDEELISLIKNLRGTDRILAAVDAPLICENMTGSRPADRECSSKFRRQEAGCHPVNKSLCQRPMELAEKLRKEKFSISSDDFRSDRIAIEVYPHPTIVRLFDLDRSIKYKKGKVAERRIEFARLQKLLKTLIDQDVALSKSKAVAESFLKLPWSKGVEDMTDALICSIIGYLHLRFEGGRTEVLGDDFTGHIVIASN